MHTRSPKERAASGARRSANAVVLEFIATALQLISYNRHFDNSDRALLCKHAVFCRQCICCVYEAVSRNRLRMRFHELCSWHQIINT